MNISTLQTSNSLIRISCPKRISPFLEQEIINLGYTPAKKDDTGVELNGTLQDCMKLNLWCRTAHRVLFHVADIDAATPDQLYKHLVELPWEEYIPEDGYISITSAVLQESITDTRFANLRVKDAIVDRIMSKTQKRPDSGPEVDRTVLFLHWRDNKASIYFDTSGETLSKHGYRKIPWKAPMQETLGAATLIAEGYTGEQNFVNPMCGSGTLAIEAALIALNRAPALFRTNFGFMHIKGYNKEVWQELRREANSAVKKSIPAKIIATDIHPEAIRGAKTNASEAGVALYIDFQTLPFEETQIPEGGGIVMINPAYGDRLDDEQTLEPIYKQIGDFFKQKCGGYTGYVFTGNMELAKKIGLKAKRRMEFYNSKIDCRLLQFELYAGTKRVSKAE